MLTQTDSPARRLMGALAKQDAAMPVDGVSVSG